MRAFFPFPPRIRLALLAAVALLSGLFAGCATTDGNYESELPWNTPQSWEGSPAIPGFDQR